MNIAGSTDEGRRIHDVRASSGHALRASRVSRGVYFWT